MINYQLKHPYLKLACDIIAIICIISILAILALGTYTNFFNNGAFNVGIRIESTPQILTITALIFTIITADIISYFLKKQKKAKL